MPTVTMPQLGEGIDEGTIGKWLKGVGDHVTIGEPLVEVVTDKVNAEVPSPFEGTLTKILVGEGHTVANDAAIAEVEVDGVSAESAAAAELVAARAAETALDPAAPAERAAAAAETALDPAAPAAERAAAAETALDPAAPAAERAVATERVAATAEASAPAAPATATEPAAPAADLKSVPLASPPSEVASASGTNGVPAVATATAVGIAVGTAASDTRMTPAVRRLAREHGVDLARVNGTGIGGRITRTDVEGAVAGGAAGSAPATPATAATPATPAVASPPAEPAAPSPVADGDSLKKLSPMRKAIAKHMTRSLEVPTAYIMVEVDMSAVVRRRTQVNAEYKAREGMSISYVAFVTKACVGALGRHPDINANWTEEGHWRRRSINVGIAVAVADGLVVPVIKDAAGKSLHELNVAINDVAKRSRNKKIQPDEMRGGTFTVDNTGWTGSILTLPIINVPEVAIITMEKVVKRPVVIEQAGGDVIAIRSMMNMCIAIDHRATDGAQAGEFLADVRGWLESVDDDTPIW